MKTFVLFPKPALLLCLLLSALSGALAQTPATAPGEGIALAIVYDNSGSMNEAVRDASGKMSPKYVIANRALNAIVDRLEAYVASAPKESPRKLSVALIVFRGGDGKAAVPLAPFNPNVIRAWITNAPNPMESTPLGNALKLAGQTVLKANAKSRQILVITDGINTLGPDPASVLPKLQAEAEKAGHFLGAHFVAFDVKASVFDPVKKLGATVVGAADETQLKEKLEFILQEKILLEDEEPKTPKK